MTDPIYIPLCFYFIFRVSFCLLHPVHIYIPLCFYFIRMRCSVKSACKWDLHSTMLLLYLDFNIFYGDVSTIYIPLCFYFISIQPFKELWNIRIYIPLCFYFIEKELTAYQYDWYLHSTMLLLYRGNWNLDRQEYCIYIPLCFYFISVGTWTGSQKNEFTFHYASTLSLPFSKRPSSKNLFTFHYASTLSYVVGTVESGCN